MARVKHKAGFISTDGIKVLTWANATVANIMWENGGVAVLEFEQADAEFLQMIVDWDIEWEQKQLDSLKKHGWLWKEIERAEHEEHILDYKAQRAKLREQGIYASQIEAGTFKYQIKADDGKSSSSGSFHFGPGETVTDPL